MDRVFLSVTFYSIYFTLEKVLTCNKIIEIMSNENYSELQINYRIYFPSPFKIYKTNSCI